MRIGKNNGRIYPITPMSTSKKQKKIKAWAVCFVLSKKCLEGDIPTFTSRAKAKEHIKELHKTDGGFTEDHHIVKVLITPIKKIKRFNPK